jgi:hypothetical protein
MRIIAMIISIFFIQSCTIVKDNNFSTEELKIINSQSINIWGFQKILKVPFEKKYYTDDNKNYLIGYRSEFHNGSENGCILVLGNLVLGKYVPQLIIEELFYGTDKYYYLRTVEKINKNSIVINLYKIQNKERKLLATLIYEKQVLGRYKISKIKLFEKISEEAAQAYSDAYFTISNDVFAGRKPYF